VLRISSVLKLKGTLNFARRDARRLRMHESFRLRAGQTMTTEGSRFRGALGSFAVVLAFAISLSPRASLAQYPAHPATRAAICAADLSARDKAISDDSFQGRGPGTAAGEAAANWIADEMKRIGLRPGNHGSDFQPVPAVTITLDAARSVFTIDTPRGALTPKFPD
jgi:hypothetical protein